MTAPSALQGRPHVPWREGLASSAFVALVTLVWVASLHGLSLSWDALNHHVYLGWLAATGRSLSQDVFAAGSMSCQYPYSYVPVYMLEKAGATGQQAALVLAMPAVASIPAVWLIAWCLEPGQGWDAITLRAVATALAFMSPLWWSLLDSTSNDLLSSAPMVWALALALWRAREEDTAGWSSAAWWGLIGALAALSMMMKISHVLAALTLMVVVGLMGTMRAFWRHVGLMTLGAAVVLLLIWWPWARSTWQACGSPFYPMFVEQLGPLRHHLP